MKKEYIKPEMAEIQVQTSNLLQASGTKSIEVSTEKATDGFASSSSFFDDGNDNSDW